MIFVVGSENRPGTASQFPESDNSPNEVEALYLLLVLSFPEISRLAKGGSKGRDYVVKAVGGKAFNLARLHQENLAPAGFTSLVDIGIWLKEHNYPDQLPRPVWEEVVDKVSEINDWNRHSDRPEVIRKLEFGNEEAPLAVSVRSGAVFSMPGAMNSILNVGINDKSVEALAEVIGPEAAWDSYLNFVLSYIIATYQLSRNQLNNLIEQTTASQLDPVKRIKAKIDLLEGLVEQLFNQKIPQDPWEQLERSILAVYGSFDSPAAIMYRQQHGLPDQDYHTAVTVQPVINGNLEEAFWGLSGSGVGYSVNMQTGDTGVPIEFAPQAQGFMVVDNQATREEVRRNLPESYYEEIRSALERLVDLYTLAIDFEFVIEAKKLWWLQIREGKPAPSALMKIIADFWYEYFPDFDPQNPKPRHKMLLFFALPPSVIASLQPSFDPIVEAKAMKTELAENVAGPCLLLEGFGVGGAALVGCLAVSVDRAEEMLQAGQKVVLVAPNLDANRLGALYQEYNGCFAGVTLRGTQHSHSASVINAQGGAGAVACGEENCRILTDGIEVNGIKIPEGTMLSVNGTSGNVFLGELELIESSLEPKIAALIAARTKLGSSMWTEAAWAAGQSHELYRLSSKIESVWQQAIRECESMKSKSQQLLSHIMPEKILMRYDVSRVTTTEEIEAVKQKLKQGLQTGCQMTLRCAYSYSAEAMELGKNPWTKFNPGQEALIDAFFADDRDTYLEYAEPVSKYGLFSDWKEDLPPGVHLNEVLVGYDPPGKLDSDLAHEHFVAGIQMQSGTRPSAKCLIYPGTIHLRALEGDGSEGVDLGPEDAIHLEIFADDRFEKGIGRVNLGFGADHLETDKLGYFLDRLIANQDLTPEEKAVYCEIANRVEREEFDNLSFDFRKSDREEMRKVLLALIDKAWIPEKVLVQLVKNRSYALTKRIQQILLSWWPALTPRMAALENLVHSPLTLEIQGRMSKNEEEIVNWMLVYGIKGFEESLAHH